MAGASGIKAGRAYVELGVGDKMLAGLRKAQARLRAFGASVGKIGRQLTGISAVALAPLAGAAKVFANMGDSLQKMAARTGITVESLSELSFAAEQSGAGIETFGKAVGSMQRSIRDAGRGLATKTESLKDLGLSYEALAALSPEDQFKTIAEAISLVPDATQRAAISMELFG